MGRVNWGHLGKRLMVARFDHNSIDPIDKIYFDSRHSGFKTVSFKSFRTSVSLTD